MFINSKNVNDDSCETKSVLKSEGFHMSIATKVFGARSERRQLKSDISNVNGSTVGYKMNGDHFMKSFTRINALRECGNNGEHGDGKVWGNRDIHLSVSSRKQYEEVDNVESVSVEIFNQTDFIHVNREHAAHCNEYFELRCMYEIKNTLPSVSYYVRKCADSIQYLCYKR